MNTTASRRSGLFKFQVFDSMTDEVFLTSLSSMVQRIDNSSWNCLRCFCCDSPDRWNSHTLADGTVQVLFSNLLAVAYAAFMINCSQHNLDKACRKYGVDIFWALGRPGRTCFAAKLHLQCAECSGLVVTSCWIRRAVIDGHCWIRRYDGLLPVLFFYNNPGDYVKCAKLGVSTDGGWLIFSCCCLSFKDPSEVSIPQPRRLSQPNLALACRSPGLIGSAECSRSATVMMMMTDRLRACVDTTSACLSR